MAPTGQESGQDCDGAFGQAPIRSLLTWSVGGLGRLENESTDHIKGTAPVPFRVRPDPRRPGKDYRSPTFADRLQSMSERLQAGANSTNVAPSGELCKGYG